MKLMDMTRKIGAFVLVAAAAGAPVFAGDPAPGPVVGAGLPALAAIGAGYWLIRKRRQR